MVPIVFGAFFVLFRPLLHHTNHNQQKMYIFFVKIIQNLLIFLCNAVIISIGYYVLNVQIDNDVEWGIHL